MTRRRPLTRPGAPRRIRAGCRPRGWPSLTRSLHCGSEAPAHRARGSGTKEEERGDVPWLGQQRDGKAHARGRGASVPRQLPQRLSADRRGFWTRKKAKSRGKVRSGELMTQKSVISDITENTGLKETEAVSTAGRRLPGPGALGPQPGPDPRRAVEERGERRAGSWWRATPDRSTDCGEGAGESSGQQPLRGEVKL